MLRSLEEYKKEKESESCMVSPRVLEMEKQVISLNEENNSLKERLKEKGDELLKVTKTTISLLQTQQENDTLKKQTLIYKQLYEELLHEVNLRIQNKEKDLFDIESKLKQDFEFIEQQIVGQLCTQSKEMEINLRRCIQMNQQLRLERNELRQRCIQLQSQVHSKTDEVEKLAMDLQQIERKHEEILHKTKAQYEQKILQLNTKVNSERNASYSTNNQTAVEMYKRKLQAAEVQIRELKKALNQK
ncbi:hypothetical protein ABK040_006564 [Willaertia magna]